MAIKILLVEDSDTQLKFLREGLEEQGFEVETASNLKGEAFVETFLLCKKTDKFRCGT